MDFYSLGEKVRKDKELSGNSSESSRVRAEFLKKSDLYDAPSSKKAEFIDGLLKGTSLAVLYEVAIDIIIDSDDKKSLNAVLLSNLEKLASKKRKPQWLFAELYSLCINSNFSVANNDMDLLVRVFVNGVSGSDTLFASLKYDNFDVEALKIAIIDNFPLFDQSKVKTLYRIDEFKDMLFYKELFKKITNMGLFGSFLTAIEEDPSSIKNFTTLDLEEIIKEYPSMFQKASNVEIMVNIIHDGYYTSNTLEDLVDMLNHTQFTNEMKLEWFLWLQDLKNNDIILKELYKMTGDESYLPKDVKDIFIF